MYFNPRSLAGATVSWITVLASAPLFQSTLPCGSDSRISTIHFLATISIHAPLRERQTLTGGLLILKLHFNPRSLAGATTPVIECDPATGISIHAPLRERRLAATVKRACVSISIHAPLRERPNWLSAIYSKIANFNPRSLAGATPLAKSEYSV